MGFKEDFGVGSESAGGFQQVFGREGQPVQVDHVLKKDMNFDHSDVRAEAWILIDRKAGKRAHIQTYDHCRGGNAPPLQWYDLEGLRKRKWRSELPKYEEVEPADCPVTVARGESTDAATKMEEFFGDSE